MVVYQDFSKPGEKAGLALIGVSGALSALSTGLLLIYITWYGFLSQNQSSPVNRGVRSFTRSSLGCYLVSLLLCDFIQGAAFTINFHWARKGFMAEGNLCTAQGSVSEVGDLGAAFWSLAISFHTFWLLFMVKRPHYIIAPALLGIGWITLIILPILGHNVIQTPERGRFYGLSGAWCWIGVSYGTERLLYLYVWVFLALGSSIIIYTLIYLRFANFIILGERGNLMLNFTRRKPPLSDPITGRTSGSVPATPRTSRRISSSGVGCFDWAKDTRDGFIASGSGSNSGPAASGHHVSKQLRQVARRLMWYPILYAIVVLPVSICRMGVLAGWEPPFPLFVFAGICFSSSGISNAILFIFTRHSVIRQVARHQQCTRIHVTTQRITVREDGLELDDMHSEADTTTRKTHFYDSNDERDFEKDRVTIEMPKLHLENEEHKAGIRVTIVGK